MPNLTNSKKIWALSLGDQFKDYLDLLPLPIKNQVKEAMKYLCCVDDPQNSKYATAQCKVNPSDHICRIGKDLTLAFVIVDEIKQLRFISLYGQR